MFLQDGIAPVIIIIIIIICLLENIVSVPWSHYGAQFEFIRYNSALNSLD
jgi:regulator of protease activity HflC (stomatin/prohibitin superfamily)